MILGLLTVGSFIWYMLTARGSGDLELIGTVDANEVLVSAKIPGRIQTLLVEEGQQVQAGQLIAVIESDDLAAARTRYASAHRRLYRRRAWVNWLTHWTLVTPSRTVRLVRRMEQLPRSLVTLLSHRVHAAG